jgi:uncharacterized protein YjbJ (UPF0337 family)
MVFLKTFLEKKLSCTQKTAMIEKLKKTLSDVSGVVKEQAVNLTDAVKEQAGNLTDAVKEQAGNLSEAVKEKTYALFEDWLKIFPNLENYGLKITSFGLCMAISPSLDVELSGDAHAFTPERLEKILAECEGNQALTTVFKTIRTTYEWHRRTGSDKHFSIILVKLSIKITPEVKVYLGQPLLT